VSAVPYRPIPLRRTRRLDLPQLELPAGMDARTLAGEKARSFELGTERITIVMPAALAAKPGDLSGAAASALPWLLLREGRLGEARAYTLDIRPTRGAHSARLVLVRSTGRVVAEGAARLVDDGRAATFELEAVDGAARVRPRFRGRLEAGRLQLEATLEKPPSKGSPNRRP
jgi:hypothetical protein